MARLVILLAYLARGSERAVDVEEADCIFDAAFVERWVDACCFGRHCIRLW